MNRPESHGMTIIVKTVTRITLGFIMLYGIYIGFSGHLSPGGGFAGGVIIALSFVHIVLAFGKRAALSKMSSYNLRFLMGAGGIIFLITIIIAPYCSNLVREYIIPACEMAMVDAAIFSIFIALVLLSKFEKGS